MHPSERFSDGFEHWAGFVVMGARTRLRPIPSGLSWAVCHGLTGGFKEIVVECILDDPHSDNDDPDNRDTVLASFAEPHVPAAESEAMEAGGILLPDAIVQASTFLGYWQALKYASQDFLKSNEHCNQHN